MIKINMTINFIIIVQIVKKILCDKGEMHNKLYMAQYKISQNTYGEEKKKYDKRCRLINCDQDFQDDEM